MGTGQLLAVRRFSLRSSTTIDLSLLTFFQSIQQLMFLSGKPRPRNSMR